MSNLRESGEIEQAADVVRFLYREDYHHPADSQFKGQAELHIASHRESPTAQIQPGVSRLPNALRQRRPNTINPVLQNKQQADPNLREPRCDLQS
jgi:DnaB-like helicase C terminal domain